MIHALAGNLFLHLWPHTAADAQPPMTVTLTVYKAPLVPPQIERLPEVRKPVAMRSSPAPAPNVIAVERVASIPSPIVVAPPQPAPEPVAVVSAPVAAIPAPTAASA